MELTQNLQGHCRDSGAVCLWTLCGQGGLPSQSVSGWEKQNLCRHHRHISGQSTCDRSPDSTFPFCERLGSGIFLPVWLVTIFVARVSSLLCLPPGFEVCYIRKALPYFPRFSFLRLLWRQKGQPGSDAVLVVPRVRGGLAVTCRALTADWLSSDGLSLGT